MGETKSTVYWITGLSGAGKTTVGSALYYKLKESHSNIVLLDGDILKDVLGSNAGYSTKERLERAYIYARMCKMLASQGINTICCSISMFDEVRKWNRENIDGYYEIFLDVPMEILVERDNKKLYTKYENGLEKEVVGLGINAEFPKTPDLVIKNDGRKHVHECVYEILRHSPSIDSSSTKDTSYWNAFYGNHLASDEPSPFAKNICSQLEKGKAILDIGCGNGRDSIYFFERGLNVTAIDASAKAIDKIKAKNDAILCVCDDFTKSQIVYHNQYDYCYSRFSIHAIGDNQQTALLNNVFGCLKNSGRFFIEVRSINDPIYGKGEQAGRNAFIYDSHYRRFVVLDELINEMECIGFKIIYSEESTGFAPFGDENPPIIRVIAEKP